MNPNVAKCVLVAKVLVADGMMMDGEKTFLDELMTRLGLTAAERKLVIEGEGWKEAEPIIKQLPHEEKQQLVEMLFDAAAADGKLSPHEHAALKSVANVLGV